MSDPTEVIWVVRQWVEKAEEDFRAAEYILTMPEDCPCATVCFHSQQCLEKLIKALLTWRSIDFPRIHDIGELVALLPEDLPLPLTEEDQERLTDFAVASRYPGEQEPVTIEEARWSVNVAQTVRRAVRLYLPGDALVRKET